MKISLKKRRAAMFALFFAVNAVLTGCVTHTADREIDLDAYEWAIFMSEYRNTGLFPRGLNGYLVLVRDDGSYDLVKHAGMDSGKISWTEHGINFADAESDHWITAQGSTVVKKDRIELMDGLVTLGDGITRVSVYNGGFQENGYREEVIISRPDSSEHHTLTTVGFYPMISACGGDVYASYSMTPEDGSARFILDQIVKDNTVKHVNVGIQRVPFSEFAYIASDAPCAAGRIYFLGDFLTDSNEQQAESEILASQIQLDSGGYKHIFALVIVDTSTGELDWLPLITENGGGLALSAQEAGYSLLDAQSLDRKGNLVWLGGDGILYRTKIATGQTSILSEKLKANNQSGMPQRLYHFSSDTDTVTVLVEDTTDPLAQPQIVVFDKTTGQIVKHVQISGLKDDVSDAMILRDIAGKPSN